MILAREVEPGRFYDVDEDQTIKYRGYRAKSLLGLHRADIL